MVGERTSQFHVRPGLRTKRLAIIRKGHMGDVLLTEPVARSLREQFDHITLFTQYIAVGSLIEAYDVVLPYERRFEAAHGGFDRVVELEYEAFPGVNHLDGYARCACVEIAYRVPRIRSGFRREVEGRYGLVAPYTSSWRRSMREWPKESFVELASRMEESFGFPFVLLEPEGTFSRMLSLIEHCQLFVGNDSGPAVLAQCFGRRAFVIFGSTRPDLILVAESAVGISSEVECMGCLHVGRYSEVVCATPICLQRLSVDAVLEQVLRGAPVT